MELHLFTNPQQGATYQQIAATATAAEDLGFGGFFRSDHLAAIGVESGLPGSTDAWLTLAALARETRRIRLGTLMTAATFRLPGPLAISVAQVDQMSGGRVDFGFGAGWYEPEHAVYGVPFPDLRERMDRFTEQLEIITGLWETPAGERFSYDGKHYQLRESPALPKPVQKPYPPIMIGGRGHRRTPRLAAWFADEYNYDFPALEDIAPLRERLAAACQRIGRDPVTLQLSAIVLLVCGRDDAEVARRSDAGALDLGEFLKNGLVGSPAQIVDGIGKLAEGGITRLYVQTPQQFDVDHIEFFAQEVFPQLD